MTSDSEISTLINGAIQESGLTQKEMGMVLGISQSAVTHYVTVKRKASAERLPFFRERLANPKELRKELERLKQNSEELDALRRQKGWSLEQLAKAAGLPHYKIWDATHGTYVEPENIEAIMQALVPSKEVATRFTGTVNLTDKEKIAIADQFIAFVQKMLASDAFDLTRT